MCNWIPREKEKISKKKKLRTNAPKFPPINKICRFKDSRCLVDPRRSKARNNIFLLLEITLNSEKIRRVNHPVQSRGRPGK